MKEVFDWFQERQVERTIEALGEKRRFGDDPPCLKRGDRRLGHIEATGLD
jgi:hypothetical protein